MTTEPVETGTSDYVPIEPTFPASESPPQVIALGELTLRRWTRSDVDLLYPVVERSVEHLRPFMVWAPVSTPDTVQDYLDRSHEQWELRTSFNYALVETATGEMAGSSGLMGRVGPGALEIGYWVAVDRTRRGLATRAAAALTAAGLAIPGVERIEIHHDNANVLSARVPAHLGYTRIGTLEVPAQAEAETGTHVVWAMTQAQWPGSPGAAVNRG